MIDVTPDTKQKFAFLINRHYLSVAIEVRPNCVNINKKNACEGGGG
jgi:hypothetical protein